LIGPSSANSFLQRTCACGQHTIAGSECKACRNERLTLRRSQTEFGPLSALAVPKGSSSVQENSPSLNTVVDRTSPFGHDFSQIPIHTTRTAVPQTKLKVNQPGDVYEQEGDHVAKQVMRTPEPIIGSSEQGNESLGTIKQSVQRKPTVSGRVAISQELDPQTQSQRSNQPLSSQERAFFEPHFRHDFSRIRIHAGVRSPEMAEDALNSESTLAFALHTAPQAAEAQADEIARRVATPEQAREGELPAGLAERLEREVGGDFRGVRVHSDTAAANRVAYHGAEAMSEGRDLYFAAGRWRPDTQEGAFVAAHEAVHAAQQGFAERGVVRGEGRYFKKDPPPKADPRDVFEEINKRAPDLAVFVSIKTINDAMAGKSNVEGPAVSGGTSGTDVHEWHVSITNSQVTHFSETLAKPIVTTKKTKHGQIVKHVVPILWGTFFPFGSGKDYETQGAEAEKAKTLPHHTARAKDFAFELKVTEPLIHELLHARIIMEQDSTFTAGPHTQLVQGYLDMIAASHLAGVKKQRDAVRTQIGLLAQLHVQKPTAAEQADVTNIYDEFLVHEKFDSQKVFELMGASGVTNKKIAEAYSGVVVNGLTIKFGEAVSEKLQRDQQLKLESATVAYYNAIDTALAAPHPASQPSSTPSTVPLPTTTVPAKTPKK
jgi:hypothetical protein